jgi:hypothetical protein
VTKLKKKGKKNTKQYAAGHRWLTPVILATQEVEIRRIVVQSQPWQIVLKENPLQIKKKKRAGGVPQGEGPKFKPQYHKNK